MGFCRGLWGGRLGGRDRRGHAEGRERRPSNDSCRTCGAIMRLGLSPPACPPSAFFRPTLAPVADEHPSEVNLCRDARTDQKHRYAPSRCIAHDTISKQCARVRPRTTAAPGHDEMSVEGSAAMSLKGSSRDRLVASMPYQRTAASRRPFERRGLSLCRLYAIGHRVYARLSDKGPVHGDAHAMIALCCRSLSRLRATP